MADHMHTELPPIAMVAGDLPRLSLLATAAAARFPETADFLAREIERASVVEDAGAPAVLVRMGSEVEFRDQEGAPARRVRLVYPEQADVSAGLISVLTPIGAALIGLSVGQSIAFAAPNGETRSLTVLAVRNAP